MTDTAGNRARHTTGPWRANSSWIEGPNMALRVACVDWPKRGNAPKSVEEAKANAKLIAAAPELYEALKALVHRNGGLAISDEMKQALAALAKAGWQSPSDKFESDLSAIKEAMR